MRVLDRYIAREVLTTLIAVCIVLMLVVLGIHFADVINKVSKGRIPLELLFSQIALKSIQSLNLFVPMSLFLGVLLAVNRMYRDSETAVMASAGFGPNAMLKPLLMLSVPVLGVLSLLALVVSPWAARVSKLSLDNANRTVVVAGLEPGRFLELPGGKAVVYVERLTPDNLAFERAFIVAQRDGRRDVLTAERGSQISDAASGERFLKLENGFRAEGAIGSPEFRLMRFGTNEIKLPPPSEANVKNVRAGASTLDLMLSNDPNDRAELHARLAAPVSALVLMLIALPLARSRPREPRYGKILIAILIYVIYSNVQAIGRGLIERGQTPEWLGLWWLHGLGLVLAFVLIQWSNRMPRVQRPALKPA
jgi:lipopolysaccharide export system permease protein